MTEKKKETKKKQAPKKETKVRAPQKKQPVENKVTKKAIIEPMVHVDEFLDNAKGVYDMDSMQLAGFKAYMSGKHYLTDMKAFVPYLNRYLDK